MRAALSSDASPETRQRLQDYLTALDDPNSRDHLQQIRGEFMHSPEWRKMLTGAAVAATIASSQSVPELYDRIAPVSTTAAHGRDERTSDAFFGHHEVVVSGVGDLLRHLSRVQWANAGLRLVWRGQQDAAWPVASSLMRGLRASGDAGEDQLVAAEREMIDSAPSWGTGSRTWSWFPAPLNERMRAQRAGFMLEASPIFSERVLGVFADALGEDWTASEIAAATTVLGLPSRHDVPAKPNDANIVPVFSLRIAASAKAPIREYLATKGLTEDRIYPDQSGFVAHLRRGLR